MSGVQKVIDYLPSGSTEEVSMASRRCPHCRAIASYERQYGNIRLRFSRVGGRFIRFDVCRDEQCGCAVAVVTDESDNDLEVFPATEEEPDILLPDDVQIAFRQTLRALNEGLWDGCVLMARRALEEAMKDLSAEGRDLYQQIEYLAEQQMITPALGEWAHEGRLAGKLGAHGKSEDPDRKWNDEVDAEEITEFCKWFFRYVYVLPKQLQQRRERLSGAAEPASEDTD